MLIYIIATFFAIFGIGIRFLKWDFLISGYNTMSEEERSNVDIEKLRNLIGNFLITISILLIISGVSYNIGRYLLILILPMTIVVINKAQKYNNKENNRNIKFLTVFMIIIFIFIAVFFSYGTKDPKVNLTDNRIIIEGMYGTAINRDKIQEITLEDKIPNVERKIEGLDLGNTLRGTFDLEDIGTATLFINYNKSPYVVIKADNKYFIINFKDSDKTIELYNSLK